MAPMIEVEGLTKSYGGKRGIAEVSFQVEEGDVFGFLGPNGAGKTTTIRLPMALLHADAGTARIAGLDCWKQSLEIKRLIGYVPGEPALDPNLTGGQILEYFTHLRSSVDHAYLKRLVERFELDIIRAGRIVRIGDVAEVKAIKRYEMTITFATAIPVETFKTLDGVLEVEALNHGHGVRLAMQGSADAVVKAAARYPVVSLTSYEP